MAILLSDLDTLKTLNALAELIIKCQDSGLISADDRERFIKFVRTLTDNEIKRLLGQ